MKITLTKREVKLLVPEIRSLFGQLPSGISGYSDKKVKKYLDALEKGVLKVNENGYCDERLYIRSTNKKIIVNVPEEQVDNCRFYSLSVQFDMMQDLVESIPVNGNRGLIILILTVLLNDARSGIDSGRVEFGRNRRTAFSLQQGTRDYSATVSDATEELTEDNPLSKDHLNISYSFHAPASISENKGERFFWISLVERLDHTLTLTINAQYAPDDVLDELEFGNICDTVVHSANESFDFCRFFDGFDPVSGVVATLDPTTRAPEELHGQSVWATFAGYHSPNPDMTRFPDVLRYIGEGLLHELEEGEQKKTKKKDSRRLFDVDLDLEGDAIANAINDRIMNAAKNLSAEQYRAVRELGEKLDRHFDLLEKCHNISQIIDKPEEKVEAEDDEEEIAPQEDEKDDHIEEELILDESNDPEEDDDNLSIYPIGEYVGLTTSWTSVRAGKYTPAGVQASVSEDKYLPTEEAHERTGTFRVSFDIQRRKLGCQIKEATLRTLVGNALRSFAEGMGTLNQQISISLLEAVSYEKEEYTTIEGAFSFSTASLDDKKVSDIYRWLTHLSKEIVSVYLPGALNVLESHWSDGLHGTLTQNTKVKGAIAFDAEITVDCLNRRRGAKHLNSSDTLMRRYYLNKIQDAKKEYQTTAYVTFFESYVPSPDGIKIGKTTMEKKENPDGTIGATFKFQIALDQIPEDCDDDLIAVYEEMIRVSKDMLEGFCDAEMPIVS